MLSLQSEWEREVLLILTINGKQAQGISELTKITQEPEGVWTSASHPHKTCAKHALSLSRADVKVTLCLYRISLDLLMCHPNRNCPGLLVQARGLLTPLYQL